MQFLLGFGAGFLMGSIGAVIARHLACSAWEKALLTLGPPVVAALLLAMTR